MTTQAASSLHRQSRDFDDLDLIANQMIQNLSKLNAEQKRRYLETIQVMLGAGIPDGTAQKNQKKLHKENWATVAEFLAEDELEAQLESIGFTEEARKASDLFFEAVEQRLNHDPFRHAVGELLSEYCPSPFISDEDLDVVEMLAHKIQELQDAIDYVEQVKATLVEEIRQNLTEENTIPERARKRSTINEHLLEPNSDNEDALFDQRPKFVDAKMRTYLRAMGDDLDD